MYIQSEKVIYEWDIAKARINSLKHGVKFETARSFEWHKALIAVDQRRDYGEERRLALGPIKGRLFAMVYVTRRHVVRISSLRKANDREVRYYEETYQD